MRFSLACAGPTDTACAISGNAGDLPARVECSQTGCTSVAPAEAPGLAAECLPKATATAILSISSTTSTGGATASSATGGALLDGATPGTAHKNDLSCVPAGGGAFDGLLNGSIGLPGPAVTAYKSTLTTAS